MLFSSSRAVLLAAAFCVAVAQERHPVVKVIDLLQSLKEKVVEDGQVEEASYAKFSYWCSTSTGVLKKAIEEEKKAIEVLEAKVDGLTKDNATLTESIENLDAEILRLEGGATESQSNRDAAEQVYIQKKGDLQNTIKALGDAIIEIKNAQEATGGAASFVSAKSHLSQALALCQAFPDIKPNPRLLAIEGQMWGLSMSSTFAPIMAGGDYEKHVEKYDFKSSNVVDLLKELKAKFEAELVQTEAEETNSLNAFALSGQARDVAVAAATKERDQKSTDLTTVQQDLVEAEGALKDQQDDLEADEGTLKTTEGECATKQREWEDRSTTRQNEVKALDSAVEILSKVTGVRTEAPSNPIPPPSPVEEAAEGGASSLVQRSQAPGPKERALELLKSAANTTHSKVLERFAMEVAAHLSGPFDEVNNMIQKMIFRLQAEQTDEDKHKAWCDLELQKSTMSKEEKDAKVAELDAKIDAEKAEVAKLTDEISDANEMVSQITSWEAEATEIRQVGKEENAVAVKHAQEAQTAIANAVAILDAFYKESGMVQKEPWEFLQKQKDPVSLTNQPDTWANSYTGAADPKEPEKGVIAILEKVAAGFATMEAEAKAQEEADQKAYDDGMKSHGVEKARRQQESTMKEEERKRRVDQIATLSSERKHVSAEVEAVEQYLKDLQPACVNGTSTYEDRKAARAQEIAALQSAQRILSTAFDQPVGPSPYPQVSSPAPTAAVLLRKASKPEKPTRFLRATHGTVF